MTSNLVRPHQRLPGLVLKNFWRLGEAPARTIDAGTSDGTGQVVGWVAQTYRERGYGTIWNGMESMTLGGYRGLTFYYPTKVYHSQIHSDYVAASPQKEHLLGTS